MPVSPTIQQSDSLRGIIQNMQGIQEWMSEFRRDDWEDKLFFLGRFSEDHPDDNAVAQNICETLGIEISESKPIDSVIESFCSKLQEAGILIFRGGTVLGEPKSILDPSEFSVFSLYDDYAPLIFINTRAMPEKQLYALICDTVCIWLGYSHVFSTAQNDLFCLYVTEKILLSLFPHGWNKSNNTADSRLCVYSMDRYFLQSLYASVQEGTTSYTQAYRLTNTWGDDFKNLAVAQTHRKPV